MSKRPLTLALANTDLAALADALDDGIVFHSPVLATTGNELRGRDLVMRIFQHAVAGTGVPRNVAEFVGEDGRYVVAYDATIGGHSLNVAFVCTDNAAGKIVDVRVLMRPLPVVELFRDHMKKEFSEIPESYWSLT